MNIDKLLEELDFIYRFDSEKKIYRLGFNLECKLKECEIIIRERQDAISIIGTISVSADKDSIADVAEYLTRANYGLLFGNFELDYRDGEIRYKLTYDVAPDTEPNKDVLGRKISIVVSMIERYADGLLAVLFHFDTPKDAIEKAEKETT